MASIESLSRAENPYHTDGPKPPGLNGEARRRFELATPFGPYPAEDGLDRVLAPGVLHVVREGWEAMRRAHPEFYIGLTIFGSTIKGRLHASSDIDFWIFVDPKSYHGGSPYDRSKRIYDDASQHITQNLRQHGYAPTFQKSYPYLQVAINTRRLCAYIDIAAEQYVRQPATFDEWTHEILALFCFRLGSGRIQEFRAQTIDTLATLPHGQEIWREMMHQLASWEEERRGASIYLPQTLEQARDYFGL